MALHRSNGPQDGLFLALEYLGRWSLAVDHRPGGPLTATAGIPELKMRTLKPGQRIGIAAGDARRLPRRAGQHGRVALRLAIRIPLGLHQRRLLCPLPLLDLVVLLLAESPGAVYGSSGQSGHDRRPCRTVGYEMLWDDAGWSSYPGAACRPNDYGSVFAQTYEGPDFAQTQRYSAKDGDAVALVVCGPPAGRSVGQQDRRLGRF